MSKLELVKLYEIPTQVGTEFCIVSQDITFCLNNFVVINKNKLKHIDCRVDIDYSSINICDNDIIMAKPHAELRALYKETGEEFDDWEVKRYNEAWETLDAQPNWFSSTKYRYNPKKENKTITINGIEVPAPETEEPSYGSVYYFVDMARSVSTYTWDNTTAERKWLRNGLVHKSKENAQKHLNALIIASGGYVGSFNKKN